VCAYQSCKRQLPEQEVGRALVFPDLAQRDRAWAKPVLLRWCRLVARDSADATACARSIAEVAARRGAAGDVSGNRHEAGDCEHVRRALTLAGAAACLCPLRCAL